VNPSAAPLCVCAVVISLAACAGARPSERADGLQPQGAQAMSDANQEKHHLRIDYIELPTTDISESKRFYGEVFGWRFQDYGPDYASLEDGRLAGGFRKEAAVKPGGPLVIMYSRELEATERSVREAGGWIVKEIFSFPGGRRFHFADPSGNELAVWSDR
jgi:predicted enzyme related to lactoylglutathione lyase